MEKPSLAGLRRKIDEIDAEIVKLLQARMEVCRAIGEIKASMGLPVTDPRREKVVLERAGMFRDVFEEIIKLCKKAQERT